MKSKNQGKINLNAVNRYDQSGFLPVSFFIYYIERTLVTYPHIPTDLMRYQKQMLFAGLGEPGQRKLMESRVLLCGCGALGTVLADTLVRAGVGFLRIVDRDYVELSNLQRQVLYDEQDVESHLPKVIAAEKKLSQINSEISIESHVLDIDHTNIESLAEGVDLILDGTDNFEVRFLINDTSLEMNIPWIYTGCVGSHGQTMTIFPHESACLRCLIGSVPEPGSMETCDTAGVLAPAIQVIASLESVAALKILSGQRELVAPHLTVIDVWDGTFRQMNIEDLRDQSNCPACHLGERLWLTGRERSQSTVLCGRNSVQISPSQNMSLSLSELAEKLASSGKVEENPWLIRIHLSDPNYDVTIFKDGRAIITGTEEANVARSLYSRLIGS